MKLKYIQDNYEQLLDSNITVNGWVLTIRSQKEISFIKLNDGSNSYGLQLVSTFNLDGMYTGVSIRATGKLVRSPAKEQPYELLVDTINILGKITEDYPLSKNKLSMEYLRKFAHLRCRTSSFGSIFRIKSGISHATHKFFESKGYLHINPNIITINECEGGAGVFQLTEKDISELSNLPKNKDTNKYDWNQDHFEKPSYLTVSSQLQLEALACSLGSIYTTNKSFRSEHSTTNKHLSEFEHLEVEDTFITIDDLMQIGEDYIKFVGNYLLEYNMDDINNLGKFVSKCLLERINTIVSTKFTRIKYNEAIDILKQAKKLSKVVEYGEDLCSEFENYLTDHFNGPVFVSHWPFSIKSFYMKRCNDGTCENFDLLMPYRVGELIGGSIREDNLETLIDSMKIKDVSEEPLKFYLELRKYGTVPHGGFGLGLDRMCMMFTGIENIKDVVAFPVYFKNCDY